MNLGTVGIWWNVVSAEQNEALFAGLREIEALGYGAIWSSGGPVPGLSERFERLLEATERIAVASAIARVSADSAQQVAGAFANLEARFPGRFLLGLGVGGDDNQRPIGRMNDYLDQLDAAQPTVPAQRRVLAALGPRMLELAARRSAGAHPYFTPVEHTRRAREALGVGPLLVPEVTVLLEADPTRARERARAFTSFYLQRAGYRRNLRALGFEERELESGGSDRLVDALVAWGDVETIAARVRAHIEAGADHVCVQLLAAEHGGGFPREGYRTLAPALLER